MTFDQYIRLASDQDTITAGLSWSQGRTTFGGLSAALALTRMQQQAGRQPLRSVSLSFCAPLTTDTAFSINGQILQTGRSVTHIESSIIQNAQLCVRLNACYGQQRDSAIRVAQPHPPAGAVGNGQRMPFISGITPEFTQHTELAFVSGGLPFSNSPHDHLRGWMRFREGDAAMTSAHVVALTDAWPPVMLQKLSTPSPCATVTWNLELVTPPEQLATPLRSTDWLWYEADIRHAHDGYGYTEARIAAADGTLLALSRQLVVIYG